MIEEIRKKKTVSKNKEAKKEEKAPAKAATTAPAKK